MRVFRKIYFLEIVKKPYESPKKILLSPAECHFPVGIPYSLRLAEIPYGRDFPLQITALPAELDSGDRSV